MLCIWNDDHTRASDCTTHVHEHAHTKGETNKTTYNPNRMEQVSRLIVWPFFKIVMKCKNAIRREQALARSIEICHRYAKHSGKTRTLRKHSCTIALDKQTRMDCSTNVCIYSLSKNNIPSREKSAKSHLSLRK